MLLMFNFDILRQVISPTIVVLSSFSVAFSARW